ncbi:multicilin [Salarias fasciatus]|uniref:multicilin n=1 Tax=Salarias fasciatus TaxID=181472 RepID=UPI001176AA50|nr:multicilin [Salarias fasciatus]
MEMKTDFGAFCQNQIGRKEGTALIYSKDKVLVPRSSSPVTVYVELPSIIEQAFSTIAWDDVEDCAIRRDTNSLSFQVNESDACDQDFGDYALDYLADSPAMLESSLSPTALVPFQGCVIPPLTPDRSFTAEDKRVKSPTGPDNTPAQDEGPWRSVTESHGSELEYSVTVNKELHNTLHRKQGEIDSLEEKNFHLRQLANRAKHLASVLEKLMTVRDSNIREAAMPCGEKPSLSPCKRQRLDEGYETESSDSVEDMLRDVSTRCNAVLHSCSTGAGLRRESDPIRMHGAFSGLHTSVLKDGSEPLGGAEAAERISSFRTSIREHSTIRTQAFPHGHAFTSRTQQGGYRFRWVPNHS